MNKDFICNTYNCVNYCLDGCGKIREITIQEGKCFDFKEKMLVYKYNLITDIPPLLSTVYVTANGGNYYEARFLGYDNYGGGVHKFHCVEVIRGNRSNHIDFFVDIYSRSEEE